MCRFEHDVHLYLFLSVTALHVEHFDTNASSRTKKLTIVKKKGLGTVHDVHTDVLPPVVAPDLLLVCMS